MGHGAWGMGHRRRNDTLNLVDTQSLILNTQCPMPNAQYPMPNALCPMPYAQCPMPCLSRDAKALPRWLIERLDSDVISAKVNCLSGT